MKNMIDKKNAIFFIEIVLN